MLLESNVTPIIVFDGARLIMKGGVEEERKKNREKNKKAAEDFMRMGNTVMAHKYFSAAVDITPSMAYEFVLVAQKLGVEYYVAPYEADAQLAYLFKCGKA